MNGRRQEFSRRNHFLVEKWINKVIDKSKVSDMIINKLLVQRTLVLVNLVYAPRSDLTDKKIISVLVLLVLLASLGNKCCHIM